LRQDLDHFVTTLEEVHPDPFFSLPQTEFTALRDGVSDALTAPLTRAEFYKRVAPLAAALNDEHTAILIPEEDYERRVIEGRPLFPLQLLFSDEMAYAAAQDGRDGPIPAGAEILEIEGVGTPDLIAELTNCLSGTRMEQRLAILERKCQPLFQLSFDFDQPFEIVYRTAESKERQTVVLSGAPQVKKDAPHFAFHALPEAKTVIIKFDEFSHIKEFETFLRDTFRKIKDDGITHLIIDLRDNPGGATAVGDVLLTYLTDQPFRQFVRAEFKISKGLKDNLRQFIPAFIRWLPIQYLHPMLRQVWRTPEGEMATYHPDTIKPKPNPLRFSGYVYVLISPYVMSSASFLAASVREYGIGTLVGQETGGSPTNYGNVWDFPLPNTGLIAWIPSSINYGHGTGPVVPDYVVEPDIARRAHGIDLELECTLKLIADKRND
jgi:hypothetical protein